MLKVFILTIINLSSDNISKLELRIDVIVTIKYFSPSIDKAVIELMSKSLGRLEYRHVGKSHQKSFFTAMMQRNLTAPCEGS